MDISRKFKEIPGQFKNIMPPTTAVAGAEA